MPSIDLVVHATHEAGVKVGGIGAALDGLLSSPVYTAAVSRSVLVGPFDPTNATETERLFSPANRFETLYSSWHGVDKLPEPVSDALFAVEQHYRCSLLYGRRRFGATDAETLLVYPQPGVKPVLDEFKAGLYFDFGVESSHFEHETEYQTVVTAALPAYAALQCLVGAPAPPPMFSWPAPGRAVLLAHEWLGLPLAYAARMIQPRAYRTVFYAHEVATARREVEGHPGHDTRFYTLMQRARATGQTLEDVLGRQDGFFKHSLIRAAWGLDGVFAVSDRVADELRFLQTGFRDRRVDVVPNGLPAPAGSLADKQRSRALLADYVHGLLGWRPDLILSHVARLVPSKALWRDLRVMECLETSLRQSGQTGALIVVASGPPAGRPVQAARAMEVEYGWPAHHRLGWPDLVDHEVDFWEAASRFNHRARALTVLFVNQFGWGGDRLGRAGAGMTWLDLRQGADAEFGQSIYEPFGIAQLEPLGFGGLCVLSSVCGSLDFIRRVGGEACPNIVVGDYVGIPDWMWTTIGQPSKIGRHTRERIEAMEAERVAATLADRLPATPDARARLLDTGAALAERMSWDVVTRDYFLPALEAVWH